MRTRRIIATTGLLANRQTLIFGTLLLFACTAASAQPTASDQRARLLAEQSRPREEIPFRPDQFDKFAGFYQLAPGGVVRVRREGKSYFIQGVGQPPIQVYPDSPTEFFTRDVTPPAQWSFDLDQANHVTRAVMHFHGREVPATRLASTDTLACQSEHALETASDAPSPGTEAALKREIQAFSSGKPDYGIMMPGLADAVRENRAYYIPLLEKLGPFKSLAFEKVIPGGLNVYEATYQNGVLEWDIAPLRPDGKIEHLMINPTNK
jgi:hypothetical protein